MTDVFLFHYFNDKLTVEEIARRLRMAWLDKWNLISGNPWHCTGSRYDFG